MEVTRLRQNVATTAFTPATSAAARETPALDRQRDAERAQRVELEAQLADQKAMYEVAMARNTAIWEMVDEQLREAALQVEQARQSQASAVAGFDRATRRASELEAQVAAALDARREIEEALARAAEAHEVATAEHASILARAVARGDELEATLERAREEREARDVEIRRLADREGQMASQLADVETARAAIERQLAATQTAIQDADVRVTRERLAASRKVAEREAELEGHLRQEREARATLERAVAEAEAAAGERDRRLAVAEQGMREAEQRLLAAEESRDRTRQALEAADAEAGQVARLRDRLEQAHRMESVGRLASEAAITCGNLLADVHQQVQPWLTASNGDAAVRQRGETVLDDVTRAAGLLRQLAGYGEEQGRMPSSADLGTIVRELEPVLKRVAGQDVDVELPEAIPALDVEVGTERVERLLINLASYGRERMPEGGRVKIEVGTTVVDGEFTSRHPNVRTGAHALITMTKSRLRGDEPDEPGRPAGAWRRLRGRTGRAPALDLGTLQALVGECGGHLWMTVEPQGDMVARLHLPLVADSVQLA
jgi:hypothetical protein